MAPFVSVFVCAVNHVIKSYMNIICIIHIT